MVVPSGDNVTSVEHREDTVVCQPLVQSDRRTRYSCSPVGSRSCDGRIHQIGFKHDSGTFRIRLCP